MFNVEKILDNFAVLQDIYCKNGAASIQPIALLQKYKSTVL
jgi:hypothetical protein